MEERILIFRMFYDHEKVYLIVHFSEFLSQSEFSLTTLFTYFLMRFFLSFFQEKIFVRSLEGFSPVKMVKMIPSHLRERENQK